MKEIILSHGKIALVDDADFDWLNQWNWRAEKTKTGWYARRFWEQGGKRRSVRMHRLIMGPGIGVDHRNRNGLDNQRHNLRRAPQSKNACNRGIRSDNTSGFAGVSWYAAYQKWKSAICISGRSKTLGYFADKIDAAWVYIVANLAAFDEFSPYYTNFCKL